MGFKGGAEGAVASGGDPFFTGVGAMFGGKGGFLDGLFGQFGQAKIGAAQGVLGGEEAGLGTLQGFQGQLAPFQQAGIGALGEFQQAIQPQIKDPVGFINNIASQFQESPGAKFQTQQGIEAARQGGVTSGQLGSGAEQKALAQFAQGITSQGQQQFLQNVLGQRQQGLQGLQGLIGSGLSADQIQSRYLQAVAEQQAQIGAAKGALAAAQAQGGIHKFLDPGGFFT